MLKLCGFHLSNYHNKIRIALLEKGVPFETVAPGGLGAGGAAGAFAEANPRAEVPTLVDGAVSVFDSTVILEYIEDAYPTPALLPKSPADRARVRTIEEVMDTHFEPINWGLSELRWFKRAEGDQAAAIEAAAARLETLGFEVVRVRPAADGVVPAAAVLDAVTAVDRGSFPVVGGVPPKVEGMALEEVLTDGVRLRAVVDADDPDVASLELTVRVRWS